MIRVLIPVFRQKLEIHLLWVRAATLIWTSALISRVRLKGELASIRGMAIKRQGLMTVMWSWWRRNGFSRLTLKRSKLCRQGWTKKLGLRSSQRFPSMTHKAVLRTGETLTQTRSGLGVLWLIQRPAKKSMRKSLILLVAWPTLRILFTHTLSRSLFLRVLRHLLSLRSLSKKVKKLRFALVKVWSLAWVRMKALMAQLNLVILVNMLALWLKLRLRK